MHEHSSTTAPRCKIVDAKPNVHKGLRWSLLGKCVHLLAFHLLDALFLIIRFAFIHSELSRTGKIGKIGKIGTG